MVTRALHRAAWQELTTNEQVDLVVLFVVSHPAARIHVRAGDDGRELALLARRGDVAHCCRGWVLAVRCRGEIP